MSPQTKSAKIAWAWGGTLLASVLLILAGFWQMLEGLAAVQSDKILNPTSGYTYRLNAEAWGWVHLVIGAFSLVIGFLLYGGKPIYRKIAIVREDRKALLRLHSGLPGGVGIRVIPRSLIAVAGYRPAEEHRKRACDMSTLYGISAARGKQMPKMVTLDVHPLQIVDWKSEGQQLNSYNMLQGFRRGPEEDPFDALADAYPTEALEEMRAVA